MPYLAIHREPGKLSRPINIQDLQNDNDALEALSRECEGRRVKLPDCDCPIHVVRRDGTAFFRHNPSHQDRHPERDAAYESEEHANLKFAALRQAMSLGYDSSVECGGVEWRADTLIMGKDGTRVAIEIQLSHHTASDVVDRTNKRLADGVETVWFFGDKMDTSVLTTDIRSRPFFRLPDKGRVDFVERMVGLYLNGAAVNLDKPSSAMVPVQPIVFEVTCSACEKQYSVIKALVAYPNEVWSDEKQPDPIYLRNDTLFSAVAQGLQKRNPRTWFYRHHYGPAHQEPYACPHCREPGTPIKLSKQLALQVPHLPETAVKVSRGLLGLKEPFNIWGAMPSPPRPINRMTPEQWRKQVARLLRPSEVKLADARRQRSNTARMEVEKERKRQEAAAEKERERKAAADVDRKHIWETITKRLKPLFERDGINFDTETWAKGKIPFSVPHDPFRDEIELKDIIDRRSTKIRAFENALNEVIAMAHLGGPVATHLLGLPVEAWKEARATEAAERAKAREEEKERIRRGNRYARIEAFRTKILPPTFGDFLLSRRDANGRNHSDIASDSDEALQAEMNRLKEIAETIESASGRRVFLQDAALKHLGNYHDAINWTRSPQKDLKGRSPENACDDIRGFDTALRILLDLNDEN